MKAAKTVRLVENPGYTTFSAGMSRLRYRRTGLDRRGWPTGEQRWEAGDRASVHLDARLAWTLVEVEFVMVPVERYWGRCGVVVRRFDGVAQTLGGLTLGDTLVVDSGHYFALWTADETREDGEGARKVYAEGSMRPPRSRRRPSSCERDGPGTGP